LSGVCRGCEMVEAAVRSLLVESTSEGSRQFRRSGQRSEERCVEELGANPAVRAFADRVVDGLPRSAEKPLHLMVCDPGGDLFAGELAAIVGSEGFRRRSALLDELVEGDRSAKAGRHSDDEFVTLIAGACTGFAQD